MKKILVPPKPSRLIESLVTIGYDFKTAIADLIDNSIQANASNVFIDILSKDFGEEPCIVICDNGIGMNLNELKNAMTFGSKKNYEKKDLGKFGLGLKTASLSKCRVLTVFSKPRSESNKKSRLNIMEWDMNNVYGSDRWEILNPNYENLSEWKKEVFDKYEKEIESGGTLIVWSDMKEFLPDLYDENQDKVERFLSDEIKNLKSHLGLVFHRFIESSINKKKKLKIFLNDVLLDSIDPFCQNEKIKQLDKKITSMSYGEDNNKKSQVTFSPYILPKESQFSSQDAYKKATSWGGKTWLSCQGFYFYRNNRLLKYGDWCSCATKDRKNILLRVAVDFNDKLDLEFQTNISKEKASIPKKYKQEVKDFLGEWIKVSRKKWHGKKGEESSSMDKKEKKYKSVNIDKIVEFKIIKHGNRILCKKTKDQKIIISVPTSHDFSDFLVKERGVVNKFKELSIVLLGILYALKNKRLKREEIPCLSDIQKHIIGE